jgi:hypothetical protein
MVMLGRSGSTGLSKRLRALAVVIGESILEETRSPFNQQQVADM